MFKPLNPLLFRSLEAAFGHVQVSNPGVSIQFHYRPDWIFRKGRLRAEVVEHGETYRVNCPFCSDTRRRLYVPYHWGVKEKRTGDDMLHLPRCFNEGCLARRDAQEELLDMVYPPRGHRRSTAAQLVEPAPRKDSAATRVVMPNGKPLADLPDEHKALEYLRGRKFDPERLAKQWGVYYCSSNRKDRGVTNRPHFCDERIVYPIMAPAVFAAGSRNAGKAAVRLAGWQARSLMVNDNKDVPKYLTSCGTKKSELLYGLPAAMKTEGPIVIVEGVTDVWRLRTNAVAMFGKSISSAQCRLIAPHFTGRPIVILLDRDAASDARTVCEKVHRTRLAAGDNATVVVAKLPCGRSDPGECTFKEAWEAVKRALAGNPGHRVRTKGVTKRRD